MIIHYDIIYNKIFILFYYIQNGILNLKRFKDLRKITHNEQLRVKFLDNQQCVNYQDCANRPIPHINDRTKGHFIGDKYLFSARWHSYHQHGQVSYHFSAFVFGRPQF